MGSVSGQTLNSGKVEIYRESVDKDISSATQLHADKKKKKNFLTVLNSFHAIPIQSHYAQQRREDLHRSIRAGDMEEMKALLNSPDGSRLAKAKNYYGN